jgi:YHS domain-containing protein
MKQFLSNNSHRQLKKLSSQGIYKLMGKNKLFSNDNNHKKFKSKNLKN